MKRPISLATARAQYVHRFTCENIPAWARKPAPNGKFYAPQYRNDTEWYENTIFPGEQGHPREENHCMSNGQTWPLGQWLNKPYQYGMGV